MYIVLKQRVPRDQQLLNYLMKEGRSVGERRREENFNDPTKIFESCENFLEGLEIRD